MSFRLKTYKCAHKNGTVVDKAYCLSQHGSVIDYKAKKMGNTSSITVHDVKYDFFFFFLVFHPKQSFFIFLRK